MLEVSTTTEVCRRGHECSGKRMTAWLGFLFAALRVVKSGSVNGGREDGEAAAAGLNFCSVGQTGFVEGEKKIIVEDDDYDLN